MQRLSRESELNRTGVGVQPGQAMTGVCAIAAAVTVDRLSACFDVSPSLTFALRIRISPPRFGKNCCPLARWLSINCNSTRTQNALSSKSFNFAFSSLPSINTMLKTCNLNIIVLGENLEDAVSNFKVSKSRTCRPISFYSLNERAAHNFPHGEASKQEEQ
ncbi:hypothetical protein ACTXT7_013320 [Hymenolepis weldensis]